MIIGLSFWPVSADLIDLISDAFGPRGEKLNGKQTKFLGKNHQIFVLFVFVALRPMSTAMVIAGRSVHLNTLFSWASLNKQLTSNRAHTFACN